MERLWHGSQEEIHALRRRLEETERLLEMASLRKDEEQSPPPNALHSLSHPLPPAPPISSPVIADNFSSTDRPSGPTSNALETLSRKIRLMSDQLNRLEPTPASGM